MKRIRFTVDINAPRSKVWNALWDNDNYQEWTKEFDPESRAVSDWMEGSSIHFLGGGGQGMYSRIDRKVPNELMRFKHLGVLKDGKEQPADEDTLRWSGSEESYRLIDKNGATELLVEMDTLEEYAGHFDKIFPKALARVKDIAEKN